MYGENEPVPFELTRQWSLKTCPVDCISGEVNTSGRPLSEDAVADQLSVLEPNPGAREASRDEMNAISNHFTLTTSTSVRVARENTVKSSYSRPSLAPKEMVQIYDEPMRRLRKGEVGVVSWNVAGVNNNPFEYWVSTMDEMPTYTTLMRDVEEVIENPDSDVDIQVNEVFTEEMWTQLRLRMEAKGIQHLDSVEKVWHDDYSQRSAVRGFLLDQELGKKRFVSMPDRMTNTIHVVARKATARAPHLEPACRPSVVNNYSGDLSSLEGFWEDWLDFMFGRRLMLRMKGETVARLPFEIIDKLRPSTYPAVTPEEEVMSIPLQMLCLAMFDTILLHLMTTISPDGDWQVVKQLLVDRLYRRKHTRTIDILSKHDKVDVIFLQETLVTFEEYLRQSPFAESHYVMQTQRLDGQRDQNSIILLLKDAFDDIHEVTETILMNFPASESNTLASGDMIAVSALHKPSDDRLCMISFHADTDGRATLRLLAAVHAAAQDPTCELRDHLFLIGMDGNVYDEPTPAQLGLQTLSVWLLEHGWTSCWGDQIKQAPCRTTCHARTYLQAQFQKGVPYEDRITKSDKNPKDLILFYKSEFVPVQPPHKDNTGNGTFLESTLLPSLNFPSDHGLIGTVLKSVHPQLNSRLGEIDESKHDFFLSHVQAEAQDAVLSLKLLLSEQSNSSFWLDTEQHPTSEGMEDGVRNCANFLLFCTQTVLDSRWVQMEVRWARQYRKNVILVAETDERHGKPDLNALIKTAPADIREIFADHVVIPWYRDPDFRQVSLNKIIAAMHNPEDLLKKKPSGHHRPEIEPVWHPWFISTALLVGVGFAEEKRKVPRLIGAGLFWSTSGVSASLCMWQLCFARGPGFIERQVILALMALHVYIIFGRWQLQRVFASPSLCDTMSHLSKRSVSKRERMYRESARAAAAMITLSATMVAAFYALTPMFLAPDYTSSDVAEDVIYGYTAGIMWFVGAPPLAVSFWLIQFLSYFAISVAQVPLEESCEGKLSRTVNRKTCVLFRRQWATGMRLYREVQHKLVPVASAGLIFIALGLTLPFSLAVRGRAIDLQAVGWSYTVRYVGLYLVALATALILMVLPFVFTSRLHHMVGKLPYLDSEDLQQQMFLDNVLEKSSFDFCIMSGIPVTPATIWWWAASLLASAAAWYFVSFELP